MSVSQTEINERMTTPDFTRFLITLAGELESVGLPMVEACKIARRETEGRVRASYKVGVRAALDAEIVVVRDMLGRRSFALMGKPASALLMQ